MFLELMMSKFVGRISGIVTYTDGSRDYIAAHLDERGNISTNISADFGSNRAILEVQDEQNWLEATLQLLSDELALNPGGSASDLKVVNDAVIHITGRVARDDGSWEDFATQYDSRGGSRVLSSNSSAVFGEFVEETIESWFGATMVDGEVTLDGVSSGSGVTFDWYVDSENGDDGNAGTSQSTAFATLSAAQSAVSAGESIGLARGAYWRERFDIPANNITIGVYGTGDMPIIDGADAVTTGWTQPDAVTYPNVWSRSWSRDSLTTTASEMLGYWQEGERTTRYANLAALQAGSNGGWHTTSLTNQTSTVSIRSAADPNSDGILREITKRHYGINGHAQILGSSRTGCAITGPIEIKRCVGHYNTLTGPKDGTVRKMLLRDGNIHHTVTESLVTEDVIATEYSPDVSPSVFVAYRSDGSVFDHTFNRCLALFSERVALNSSSAFYAHASTGDAEARDVTLQGCVADNISLGSAAADSFTATGCYSRAAWDSMVAVSSRENTIRYFLGVDPSGISGSGSNRAGVRRLSNATFTPTLDLRDSVFLVRLGSASLIGNTYTTTIRNCTFIRPGNTVFSGVTGDRCTPDMSYCIIQGGRNLNEIATGYVGDYNIFYFEGQPAPQFHFDGTVYGGLTMTAFQAASGQDSNSVFLKAADQVSGNGIAFWLGLANGTNNGPYDGDYRINPAAKVYAGDGTALVGTFADSTTPITAAGPQAYWDFNQRAAVSGVITQYPTLPADIAEMRTYLEDPEAWDFYPS